MKIVSDKDILEVKKKLSQTEKYWDGLVELEQLHIPDSAMILKQLSHADWFIRWSFLIKMRHCKDKYALQRIFNMILDSDKHVSIKAKELVYELSKDNMSFFIKHLDINDYRLRQFCYAVLLKQGSNAIDALHQSVGKHSIIISTQAIQLIWEIEGKHSIPFLIHYLKKRMLQRHTLVLLALLKQSKSVPYFVYYYKFPRLKQHCIGCIKMFGIEKAIPIIIKQLKVKKLKEQASDLLQKLASRSIPYLTEEVVKYNNSDALELLQKIPFKPQDKDQLVNQIKKDPIYFQKLKPIIELTY